MYLSRHWNLFEYNGYNGFHWNGFSPPHTTGVEFSKSLTNRQMCFSIGIYSSPMDPMDSIRTTFYPLIQHQWNENELFHRNLFVSNGSNGLHRNDFPPSHPTWVEFFKSPTNRKWTFPLESLRVQWIRWTPSERLSTPSSNMSGIFLRLSRIENELFHRNLFVSNGSDGLHRNDFPPPHPTWVESY